MSDQKNIPVMPKSSWIDAPAGSDFPVQNIPFGIFSTGGGSAHPCTRVGDTVVDLRVLAEAGLLNGLAIEAEAFQADTLNPLMRHGKAVMRKLRQRLGELLAAENATFRDNAELRKKALFPLEKCTLHLPVEVGDYTDFYSSREHAFNVGTMFRGPENALMPNWLHLPVGYHGRASSIVVSGTPLHRPMGQMRPTPEAATGVRRQQTARLRTGDRVHHLPRQTVGPAHHHRKAEDHIFGMVLFNDWSARDIQSWEYVPLGPLPWQELRQ
jgi:fumarylacetoacetase